MEIQNEYNEFVDSVDGPAEATAIVANDTRPISGTTESPQAPTVGMMNFFQQLFATGHVDLTIRIMKVNDKLTIGVDPGMRSKGVLPCNFTGTPDQLDAEFFLKIVPGVNEVKSLTDNLAEVKKNISTKAEKAATTPKTVKQVKKPSNAAKKVAPKKKITKQVKKKAPVVKKTVPEVKKPVPKKLEPVEVVKAPAHDLFSSPVINDEVTP